MSTSAEWTQTDLLALVRKALPEPVSEAETKGGLLIEAGDPGKVAMKATAAGVTVLLYGIRWDGPSRLVPNHRPLAHIRWRDLPTAREEAAAVLRHLIEAAQMIRLATFRTCRFCQESTPPEWMHDEDVCQGCAEKHLGIVH